MTIQNTYKPNEFAKLVGVTVMTLQRWDNSNKLKAFRTPTNRRYYTHEQYLEYKGLLNKTEEKDNRKTVIYARVSSRNQKDDLKNQVEFLKQYANARGIIVDEVIEDLGSGLNYNRKKWNDLLDEVMGNKIKLILISNKDRFIRFGYDWFDRLCNKFNVTIEIVNNESLSPNEELVQDIISILHVFSCRLYGLRKYKNQIKGDDNLVKGL